MPLQSRRFATGQFSQPQQVGSSATNAAKIAGVSSNACSAAVRAEIAPTKPAGRLAVGLGSFAACSAFFGGSTGGMASGASRLLPVFPRQVARPEPAQRPISITVAKPEQVAKVAAQAQSVINLESAPEKSDRQLAKAIGVSQPTVSATRKGMEEKGELIKSITSTGADGKEYPRQVSALKKQCCRYSTD